MFRLDGKAAIITGGSGGIGYEVARVLAEAGANIAIWYAHSKKTHALAETIASDFNVKVKAYQVAVEDYAAVEKAVATVEEEFGRLDIMVANAGISTKAGGLDDLVEDWNTVRVIDFDGAYYCVRAVGLVFRKQGSGNCIFTASMSGHAANVPQEQSCSFGAAPEC
ncbi:short chain dehydrogenase [Paraphaeosphaeria minitans]|uniref:Short chain dehydrogenase n=1 Tax=Paraphaeosphaeria minitans TaxID=565426 RepID=A0A9P6G8T4_9PLEO|nr:short chain dehydrogenase [Paraphaeosphaeria minitans]